MHFSRNILICYQARGSAGYLDLQRFVKLLYMFNDRQINIYILSRKPISEDLLNIDQKSSNINLYNISFLKALLIRTSASIFVMPNFFDSLILFGRKILFRDFNSQFAVIHNPPLQLSSKNLFINFIGISFQFIFYLFSNVNIYLCEFVSRKWFNYKSSIIQILPDLCTYNQLNSVKDFNLSKKNDHIHFLIIGRWLPYKSLKLLIGALSMINKYELNTKILISIKGTSYPDSEITCLIKAASNKNILIDYCDYYIPDSEVDRILLSCDYCLFLYSEASQSGFMQRCKELLVPVICTKVGGLEEYLKNGAIGHAVNPDFQSIKSLVTQISNSYPYPFEYTGSVNQSQPLIDYLKANYLKN